MTDSSIAGLTGGAGLTMTSSGGDTYTARMSNGQHFSVRQEAWSVKTDYYLDTFVHNLPEIVAHLEGTGNALKQILEMGVARGVLSIGFALLTGKDTRIVGIDIEESARMLVAENARLNGVGEKVAVRIGDLFAPVAAGETFDLVFGEMPFIPVDPVLQQQYVQDGYASEILNVSGGPDGRYFVDVLINRGAKLVNPGGALLLVQPSFIGVGRTIELMAAQGLEATVVVSREWNLADTKFTLRSREYIESVYPGCFDESASGAAVFYVTIVVGVKPSQVGAVRGATNA